MPILHILVPALAESASLLARLTEGGAYLVLAGSAILAEEFAPMVAGLAAQQGHIGFFRAVLACTIGIWAASMLLYGIGRWNAAWVRLMVRRRNARIVSRLIRAMRARPWPSVILSRAAVGVRLGLPVACGAARIDLGVFAVGTFIGTVAWTGSFAILGWFFGESAVLLFGSIRKYEDLVLGALIVVGSIGYFLVRRRVRRKELREASRAASSAPK